MESWYFTPKVGIRSSIGEINFGDSPKDVKKILGSSCDEMTENAGGTGCWLRFEYLNSNLVYILFGEGLVILEDIEIEISRTTKSQLRSYLKKKEFTIEKSDLLDWESCPEIYMIFASSKDVGGETDTISGIGLYCDEYLNFLMAPKVVSK
jgi:hypothetical protein